MARSEAQKAADKRYRDAHKKIRLYGIKSLFSLSYTIVLNYTVLKHVIVIDEAHHGFIIVLNYTILKRL